jgi:myo-inositol-1(or 4)-monophosphatase
MAASALLTIMVNAARKAARSLTRDFGELENLQVSRKGPADFVSNADRRAEEIVFNELRKARPTYGFLMEESGEVKGTDGQHRWIIDPLDGTTNFLHAIPLFAVSIGLQRGPDIVAGVIYNPITDELFTAERGSGAFLNDKRLRVGARTSLADCVGVTGIKRTVAERDARDVRTVARMNTVLAGIRRTGSACVDLAWLAAGRFDLMWETGLNPWDMAAGICLVREAGGTITDMDGGADMFGKGTLVGGNETVQRALVKELAQIA